MKIYKKTLQYGDLFCESVSVIILKHPIVKPEVNHNEPFLAILGNNAPRRNSLDIAYSLQLGVAQIILHRAEKVIVVQSFLEFFTVEYWVKRGVSRYTVRGIAPSCVPRMHVVDIRTKHVEPISRKSLKIRHLGLSGKLHFKPKPVVVIFINLGKQPVVRQPLLVFNVVLCNAFSVLCKFQDLLIINRICYPRTSGAYFLSLELQYFTLAAYDFKEPNSSKLNETGQAISSTMTLNCSSVM